MYVRILLPPYNVSIIERCFIIWRERTWKTFSLSDERMRYRKSCALRTRVLQAVLARTTQVSQIRRRWAEVARVEHVLRKVEVSSAMEAVVAEERAVVAAATVKAGRLQQRSKTVVRGVLNATSSAGTFASCSIISRSRTKRLTLLTSTIPTPSSPKWYEIAWYKPSTTLSYIHTRTCCSRLDGLDTWIEWLDK